MIAGLLLTGTLRAEFTVSSGFDYSTGDYGLPLSTEIITIPFAVSYTVQATTLDLSLPYLRVNGPGDVIPGIGRYAGRVRVTKSVTRGLGDLTLGATHQFAAPEGQNWSWSAGAEYKFGTASTDKNLGTGKDDFAAHVDLNCQHGALTPFATLGFRWLGNPAGADLRDYLYATAGINWAYSEKVTVAALVDWSEKNSDSGKSSSNFTVSVSRTLGSGWTAQAYGMLGGSDATPDYGVGLSLSRSF